MTIYILVLLGLCLRLAGNEREWDLNNWFGYTIQLYKIFV